MNKIILALCFFAFAFGFETKPVSAAMKLGVYIAPKVGANFQSKDDARVVLDNALSTSNLSANNNFALNGGLALGYDFQYITFLPFRVEAEFMFRTGTKADNAWSVGQVHYDSEQKITLDTYFLNVYYDFHNLSPVTPYVGAGVGIAEVENELKVNGVNGSQTGTYGAMNIGFGASVVLIEDFVLDLGYRYVYPSEVEHTFINDTSKIRPTTHDINLGLRYTF